MDPELAAARAAWVAARTAAASRTDRPNIVWLDGAPSELNPLSYNSALSDAEFAPLQRFLMSPPPGVEFERVTIPAYGVVVPRHVAALAGMRTRSVSAALTRTSPPGLGAAVAAFVESSEGLDYVSFEVFSKPEEAAAVLAAAGRNASVRVLRVYASGLTPTARETVWVAVAAAVRTGHVESLVVEVDAQDGSSVAPVLAAVADSAALTELAVDVFGVAREPDVAAVVAAVRSSRSLRDFKIADSWDDENHEGDDRDDERGAAVIAALRGRSTALERVEAFGRVAAMGGYTRGRVLAALEPTRRAVVGSKVQRVVAGGGDHAIAARVLRFMLDPDLVRSAAAPPP